MKKRFDIDFRLTKHQEFCLYFWKPILMKLSFFWLSLLTLDCIVVLVISNKLFLLFIWLSLNCAKLCSLFSFLLIWVFLTILIVFITWLVLLWYMFHSDFSVLFPILLNYFLDNLNCFLILVYYYRIWFNCVIVEYCYVCVFSWLFVICNTLTFVV